MEAGQTGFSRLSGTLGAFAPSDTGAWINPSLPPETLLTPRHEQHLHRKAHPDPDPVSSW